MLSRVQKEKRQWEIKVRSGPTHTPGTRQGEDIKEEDGKESGREDTGTTGAGRPAGTSTARDSTAINPDECGVRLGWPEACRRPERISDCRLPIAD